MLQMQPLDQQLLQVEQVLAMFMTALLTAMIMIVF